MRDSSKEAMARNKFTVTLGEDELGVFDETQFMLSDAFVLENETGLTINQMLGGIIAYRPNALRALVWFMKFKRGDNQHISTIEFALTDLVTVAVPDPTEASPETNEIDTSGSSPSIAG